MKNIIFDIWTLLSENTPFVLATIIQKEGSAPRKIGARMIVLQDGNIINTIGGGYLEARVIEDAFTLFKSGQSQISDYHLSGKDADSEDMICGGRITVLLEWIEADEDTKTLFQKTINLIQEKKNFMFVTGYIKNGGSPSIELKRDILTAERALSGDQKVPDKLKRYMENISPPAIHMEDGQHGFFIESFGTPETVFIFGAGHIAKQIATLTDVIGMETVVLDDRKTFASSNRFRSADVIVPVDFKKAFEGLTITAGSYIIIVTRGHIYDRDVLREALKTDAKYIGMIGSKRKRDIIYQSLVKECISPDDLKRVHCPIGIDIGSETPEEIAVSIVAELISVRRGKKYLAK